jgi:two-component system sensor histidine kinase TctE
MAKGERRLRSVLIASLLAPLLALLVLDTAVSWWTASRLADQAYDRGLHEIAREAALHVRDGPQGPWLQLSAAAQQALLVDQDDRLALRIWTEDGRPLGGDGDLQPPARLPARDGRPAFYASWLHGEPVRVAVSWQPYEENGRGRVLVQVAESLHKRHRLAWEIVGSIVAAQVVLIGMACAAVYWGVAQGLKPLNALGRAVSRRSHQDLSPLDADRAPAEVRPLVEEVNALMLRLGATLDAQNRFVADAAHQLKTPVAGLKAQIELALGEDDLPRVRHSLAQVYVSAERLSRIVQQLLALARNEPGAVAAMQLQSVDLEAFALEICMEWVPQALRRSIDLGFDGEQRPAVIDADPDRLRDLVNNLIDNAVRYSREGGRVTVTVRDSGAERTLSISDDGPTIPPQERTRVFERFHRLLGGKAEGSGLGLAIVSEIAALHGARITVGEDHDGTGNTFTVHFPPPRAAGGSA